jgi:hypothetical protein
LVLGLLVGIESLFGGRARADLPVCADPYISAPRPTCQWQRNGCWWSCPGYDGREVTVSVLAPPTQAGSVNVNLAAACGPLDCSISVPVTGSETAGQHCEDLVQAIARSTCASGAFIVVTDRCGSPAADFAVALGCDALSMTLGISTGSVFLQFDQTYLGPLADGESENIVAGAPPVPASVPALPTGFVAGAALTLAAAGLFALGRPTSGTRRRLR